MPTASQSPHVVANNPHPQQNAGQRQVPHDPDLRQALHIMLEQMTGLAAAVRQNITDNEWAHIPLYFVEDMFQPAAVVGVPVVANPQTGGLELVKFVTCSVPAAATGTLRLGSHYMPVGPGVTSFGVGIVLAASDPRSLTLSGGPGPAALWVMGTQLPTFGVLAP